MIQSAIQNRTEQQEGDRVLLPFDTSSEYVRQVLAALGTHCFIPKLPAPTAQLKQALRASYHPPAKSGPVRKH